MKEQFKSLFAGGFMAVALFGAAGAGQFEESIAALQRSDFTTAMRLLRPLADRGNSDAQFNLGWIYANGKGVPQDYQEAIVWYRKAADQGIPGAQFNLGEAYAKGMGVPQDYVQAASWYRKAAEAGYAGAWAALSRISPSDNEVQKLAVTARQCSEAALRRYALSSADPAEKVAQAAFDKCTDLWRREGEAVGAIIDASPETAKTRASCIKFGLSNCNHSTSVSAIGAAEQTFVHDATIEVFDIRAEAAGK